MVHLLYRVKDNSEFYQLAIKSQDCFNNVTDMAMLAARAIKVKKLAATFTVFLIVVFGTTSQFLKSTEIAAPLLKGSSVLSSSVLTNLLTS